MDSVIGVAKDEFLASQTGQQWEQGLKSKGLDSSQIVGLMGGQIFKLFQEIVHKSFHELDDNQRVLLATFLKAAGLEGVNGTDGLLAAKNSISLQTMPCEGEGDRMVCVLSLQTGNVAEPRRLQLLWERQKESWIVPWKLMGVLGLMGK
jgi:hypothetical protein